MADKTMKFTVTADDRASGVFARVGVAVGKLTDQLDELGRKRPNPKVTADTEQAKTRIQELNAALRALRNQRFRVDLDMGSARADVGDLRRELSYLRDVKVKLDVQAGTSQATVSNIAAKMRDLRDAKVKVTVDAAAASIGVSRIVAKLAELRDIKVRIEVDLHPPGIDAALRSLSRAVTRLAAMPDVKVRIQVELHPPGIEVRLASLATLLRGLRGSTNHDVNVNTSGAARAVAFKALLVALGAAALYAVPALASLTSGAVTLGGSLVSLAGLAPLAVGGLTAMGVAAGALAVGLAHVGDALGPTGTPAQIKKVNEAMAALSPTARAVVTEIRALGPVWSTLRLDVQERLFKGLAGEMGKLAGTYLPVFKTGLGGISDQFNLLGKDIIGFAQSAATVNDVKTIFYNTGAAMAAARPAATNLLTAFRDIAVVGTSMLPELATGWTNATGRFREFIAEARETGKLEQWIRGGLDTLRQLGQVAANTGGILGALYTAAKESGADFLSTLVRVTGGVEDFLRSARGQNTLVAFFTESRAAIDAVLPGLATLGGAVADAIGAFSNTGGLVAFGRTVGDVASTIAPLVVSLGELAGGTLGALSGAASVAAAALSPLVSIVTGVVGALGGLAPTIAATALGFLALRAGVAFIAPALAAIATGIGTVVTGLTGFAVVGAAAAASVGRAFAALTSTPALLAFAAAFVVIGAAVNAANIELDSVAKGMLAGGEAARQARADFEAHNAQFREGSILAGLFAKSEADLTAEINNQIGALGAVEQAQARAQMAQTAYDEAVRLFTVNSPQAQSALNNLQAATGEVEFQQRLAADATKTHTDRMMEQVAAAQSAASADVGYEQALLRVEQAQIGATAAAARHKEGSVELRTANLAVTQANLDAAAAAGRKAEADAVARGESDSAAQGSNAYTLELIRLAGQASGGTRTALLGYIGNLGQSQIDANKAAIEAAGLTGEIRAIPPSSITQFNTPGLDAARAGITGLTREILNINGKTVDIFVTATGKGGIASAGRLATGGILPGYTPGRDVHRFVGAAGALDLSGGEAIMRPEWTRAVGPGYVNRANQAARAGGEAGVREFLGGRQFAVGGIYRDVTARVHYRKDMSGFNAAMAALEDRAVQAGKAKYEASLAATGGPLGGGGGGGGWQWQMNVLRQRFAGLQLISGFRPGAITATGRRSYHGKGRAVDIPPRMDVFNWIRGTYGGNTKELIFSPANGAQVNNGRPHMYTGITRSNHFDHVHWAYRNGGIVPGASPQVFDKGGILQPGRTAVNLSGRPEMVLSPQQTQALAGGGLVQVRHGSVPQAQWDQLRRMGYRGRPGDNAEALYVSPQHLRSSGATPASGQAPARSLGASPVGGLTPTRWQALTPAQARAGWFTHEDGSQSNVNEAKWNSPQLQGWRTATRNQSIAAAVNRANPAAGASNSIRPRNGAGGQITLQLGPVVAAIQALRSDMRTLQRQVHINNHFAVELGQVASRVAQVQRAQSAMGMFD